ncbi:unnamed protein product [Diamesa serratosioi]
MKVFGVILSLVLINCALAARPRNDPWRTQTIRLQKPLDYKEDVTLVRDSKIVNGFTATVINEFSYQALIFIDRPIVKGIQCGAAILSERWIVSARHCVNEAVSIEIRAAGLTRNTYALKTYATSLAKSDLSDVAVISMKDKVTFSNAINYVRLPRISQKNYLFTGYVATVTGFGVDNQATYSVSNNLQYTTVKIITNEECSRVYGATNATVLCAVGYPNIKSSSCPGDSGGPLVIVDSGIPTIIGTVGYGAAEGCDRGLPVGYSRMTAQMDWITMYTGIALRP